MTTIQIEARLSAEQIFQAIRQLPAKELEKLAARVEKLRGQRPRARAARPDETELLALAQSKLPPEIWAEYSHLRATLRGGELSPAEHTRMLELVKLTESHNAGRIRALAELAEFRQQSLTAVMNDLGIKPPEYE